jgi:CBS domain-containing protein
MLASDLMRKDCICFDADEKLSAAAKRLYLAKQSEAPVVRKGRFIGMFSTSDIARVLVKQSMFGKAAYADFSKTKDDPLCRHIHSASATLRLDSDMTSAFLALLHKNVGAIPVVERGSLVGVVLASDLRKQMAKMMSAKGKVPQRKGAQRQPEKKGFSLFGRARQPVHDSAASIAEQELHGGKTSIDLILQYVQAKGAATTKQVAAVFRLTEPEIEEYAIALEKHGLLKVEYDMLGKMKLRKVG